MRPMPRGSPRWRGADRGTEGRGPRLIITRQLARVHGDMERTAGGFANRLRRLEGDLTNTAATIGTQLMPAFESLLGVVADSLAGVGAFVRANGADPGVGAGGQRRDRAGEVGVQGLSAAIRNTLANLLGFGTVFARTMSHVVGTMQDVFGVDFRRALADFGGDRDAARKALADGAKGPAEAEAKARAGLDAALGKDAAGEGEHKARTEGLVESASGSRKGRSEGHDARETAQGRGTAAGRPERTARRAAPPAPRPGVRRLLRTSHARFDVHDQRRALLGIHG